MDPNLDPKIDQNPSLRPPGVQDEPKVPPRPLPDLQNEVSDLQNAPPGLKRSTKNNAKIACVLFGAAIWKSAQRLWRVLVSHRLPLHWPSW